MGSAYSVDSRDRGRGTEVGSGWYWRENREGMVMKGEGRGVALLSFGEGSACGTLLWFLGCERHWCFPMCYRFLGSPWGIGGALTYWSFGVSLSVPPHTLPYHQLDPVAVGRSLGHVRGFYNRAIEGMHGTRGGCSIIVAIGVDMPLGKSLYWPWRVHSISD